MKPERLKNNRKTYRDYWWQYAEKRPAMVGAIKGLDRVLVVARVSRTAVATMVPAGQVLNEKVVVFATDDFKWLTLLNSNIHTQWAWKYSATLKSDLQYTPSDCFETFPIPEEFSTLGNLGEELNKGRSLAMETRHLGLTKLYNLIHDPSVKDGDIESIRQIHRTIDEAVAETYGIPDMNLRHGFHETRQGIRYTIAPAWSVEALDFLLSLNHEMMQEETKVGRNPQKKSAQKRVASTSISDALF
ncbi:hypothetical protein OIM90_14265 [Streptomyces sp. AD16]|nr:hypothetical protein OIM90_14265 [Streptomyces sp. AD16]